jgi:hypothetical protein
MGHRAKPSGITLTVQDASLVKGMLARGDRQHDVAAWFGDGRVAEIATGATFPWVKPVDKADLPPPGLYPCGREAAAALNALTQAKTALAAAGGNDSVVRQANRLIIVSGKGNV